MIYPWKPSQNQTIFTISSEVLGPGAACGPSVSFLGPSVGSDPVPSCLDRLCLLSMSGVLFLSRLARSILFMPGVFLWVPLESHFPQIWILRSHPSIHPFKRASYGLLKGLIGLSKGLVGSLNGLIRQVKRTL